MQITLSYQFNRLRVCCEMGRSSQTMMSRESTVRTRIKNLIGIAMPTLLAGGTSFL